jgi:hypothetical protein
MSGAVLLPYPPRRPGLLVPRRRTAVGPGPALNGIRFLASAVGNDRVDPIPALMGFGAVSRGSLVDVQTVQYSDPEFNTYPYSTRTGTWIPDVAEPDGDYSFDVWITDASNMYPCELQVYELFNGQAAGGAIIYPLPTYYGSIFDLQFQIFYQRAGGRYTNLNVIPYVP